MAFKIILLTNFHDIDAHRENWRFRYICGYMFKEGDMSIPFRFAFANYVVMKHRFGDHWSRFRQFNMNGAMALDEIQHSSSNSTNL